MISLWAGQYVAADPAIAKFFTFDAPTLAILIAVYGFIASILPVWLLLAPRDYLSSFLKIGTILLLAVGILIVLPELRMPAVTRFIDGTGPVFSGPLFPFLFITIACGAVSGFHSLVSSGTTPKMIEKESHENASFRLGFRREGNVNRHLVPVKIGVVCRTDEGVQADGAAFHQYGFEGLYP